MTTIHIPTIEEIYRISYITTKGWKLNYDGYWQKEGFVNPCYDDELHKHLKRNPEDFNLDDAYWA